MASRRAICPSAATWPCPCSGAIETCWAAFSSGIPKPAFSPSVRNPIVTSIAGNAGVALENARLHQELAEIANRFTALANTIPQLAWMCKPDGELFWYNDRWYEYTGTDRAASWVGAGNRCSIPTSCHAFCEKWKAALASGEPWEDTFPLRRHDGTFRWHLSQARPFRDSSGKITVWFGTNTDITQQREFAEERERLLAAERAARSEAERVGRMKDEFLATLSHELRTPLSAMLGLVAIAARAG